MRTLGRLLLLASLCTSSMTFAQPAKPAPKPLVTPKPNVPEVVGATEVVKIAPTGGFVDDPIALDGERLAYIVADASAKAELHVLTLATKAEVVIDLAAVTLTPVQLVLVGKRALVVGRADDGNLVAQLVELDAKAKKPVVYKLAPATDVTVITRDGKQRIALHRVNGAKHEVEVVAIESGKRVGAVRSLEVTSGKNEKLGFTINHWSDGFTRAHGIKQGEWDRKENQRTPDFETTYDLVTGTFRDKKQITDLFEQRRRFQTLADANGRTDYVRMAWDNSSVQLIRAGALRTVELDQVITQYDPASLQGSLDADGSAWFALKVDPVNQEAVARKKADPEYVDIYRVAADGTKATRKARILAHQVRMRFGARGERFWVVERNTGFERGGKFVALYQ